MISLAEFSTFVFHLAKAVPTFAPNFKDHETVGIWFNAFSGCDMAELRKVYAHVRDNEKQFPSIARLKELLSANSKNRFDELVGLIGKYGRYRPPQVDYALGKTINRLGGWQKICDWENDELPFRQKDFDVIYRDVLDSMAVGNADSIESVKLVGEHTTAEAFLPGSKELKALPGGATPDEPLPVVGIDWEAIRKVHPTLNLDLADRLKERGFFKMDDRPGILFRYCFGAVPGKGWPHSFVDADEHTQKARARTQSGDSGQVDPNRFDSSKYSYERFTD